MEYSNKGNIKKAFKIFAMPIIVLFIVLFIIKGVLFLAPICLIGYFLYKGIKKIKTKFKFKNVSCASGNINSSSKKHSNFDSKVIDVEYEDI